MEAQPKTDLKAVLAKGRQLLDARDVDGYWKLMTQHDPFAELAGDIAAGRGPFAIMARGHLQRNAVAKKGRELNDQEWRALAFGIANEDLITRQINVEQSNDIRVTSEDTERYHRPALITAGFDANAFPAAHAASTAAAAKALFAWPRPGRMGEGPARNLQNGINGLGRESLGAGWPDIAVDGVIGPQTVSAFDRLNTVLKPGTITRYLDETFEII